MMSWLLLAGSILFSAGCIGPRTVAQGVVAEGIEVGGMGYAEAAAKVREAIASALPPLIVQSPSETLIVRWPELSFSDDLPARLRSARRNERISVCVRRDWADAESRLLALCERNACAPQDARLTFSREGFSYSSGHTGRACSYQKLLSDVTEALRTGATQVTLRVRELMPAVTEEALRARTCLLSRFSTRFDAGNAPRARNVARAAYLLSGSVIPPGGEFSFNAAVGPRTEENGFSRATVIADGEFTEGMGGGVCQTSTTLFNAALLAGMTVTESHGHSLSVGYVPPSLDAMVSEYSDLKFRNPHPFPVYLLASAERGEVTASLYGCSDGSAYRTESVTLETVEPPPPREVQGEEDRVLRAGKRGMISESFLLHFDGEGKLLSRRRIRRDVYAAVQGIVQKKPVSPEEMPADFPSGGKILQKAGKMSCIFPKIPL